MIISLEWGFGSSEPLSHHSTISEQVSLWESEAGQKVKSKLHVKYLYGHFKFQTCHFSNSRHVYVCHFKMIDQCFLPVSCIILHFTLCVVSQFQPPSRWKMSLQSDFRAPNSEMKIPCESKRGTWQNLFLPSLCLQLQSQTRTPPQMRSHTGHCPEETWVTSSRLCHCRAYFKVWAYKAHLNSWHFFVIRWNIFAIFQLFLHTHTVDIQTMNCDLWPMR